ncbi:MAG: hypothetical protein JW768_01495 [Chitinispirillaceae bacterium]|nr:hypothetical protein [Chitinispirillaceae bacterium]
MRRFACFIPAAPVSRWLPVLFAYAFFSIALAGLPPDLPGDEISHEQLDWSIPKDTATTQLTITKKGTGLPWLDQAQKTWDAPALAKQMSGSENFVPIGKGGIFVARFTSEGTAPDVNVLDARGRTVASGNPGQTFRVEPGTFHVLLGSGAHNQRMVRTVSVEEGKITPLVPDWSALAIETIDSMAVPFRGEYELVRIDKFETYGRGFGANPNLGEEVKTWILKPGIYKVLGVGQSYNSLINFVTVRLIPGELCRLLLVQSRSDMRILGGGTVEVTPQSKLSSSWKYGANIGGNLKFNSKTDRESNDTTMSTLFGLLSTLWLTFDRPPFEWQTRARLDEGFNFSGIKVGNLLTDADDFLLNSLLIWRFFSWFGPYARAELRTTFLPRRSIRDEKTSFYCVLEHDYSADTAGSRFDSSSTFRLKPSFSPLLLDAGLGANADVFNFSFLETKVRAGFGSSFSYLPDRYNIVDSTSVKWDTTDPSDSLFRSLVARSVILHPEKATSSFGFGPQASISGMVRLGRVITSDAELKFFAPVAPTQRLMRPDFDLLANVSWRLSRWITLDYTYIYLLKQDVDVQIDQSTHGVWLRFSYTSR